MHLILEFSHPVPLWQSIELFHLRFSHVVNHFDTLSGKSNRSQFLIISDHYLQVEFKYNDHEKERAASLDYLNKYVRDV